VKLIKNKVAETKIGYKKKSKFLQGKIKKMKIEQDAVLKELRKNIKNSNTIEEELKLEKGQVVEELKFEKEKINNLKKMVECPICLEVPRKGPIFMCSNGHFLCEKCRQEDCPTCREVMGDNKSILAVAVIENILHDCKFAGCELEYPLDKIEDHEKSCKHRNVSCPYYSACTEKVPLPKLLNHLEKTCSFNKTPTVIESSVERSLFLTAPNISIPFLHWKARTYSYQGFDFAICAEKSDDHYHFNVVMFESSEVCSRFDIEIGVYAAKGSASSTKRHAAKVFCNPCSIDQTKSELKALGLTVHHLAMEKMALTVKENGVELAISVTFL